MRRTIRVGLAGILLCGLTIADSADAQISRTLGSRTTTISEAPAPIEPESLAPSTAEPGLTEDASIDYAERPRFIWVARLHDPAIDSEIEVAPTPIGFSTPQHQLRELLGLAAFNPAIRKGKIRIQTLGKFGDLDYEIEIGIGSLNSRTLLEPDIEDSEIRSAVIVVSSDVPLVLDGYFRRVELHSQGDAWHEGSGTRGYALGRGYSNESRRSIPFHSIDCDDPDTLAVCNLPMASAPWSEHLY